MQACSGAERCPEREIWRNDGYEKRDYIRPFAIAGLKQSLKQSLKCRWPHAINKSRLVKNNHMNLKRLFVVGSIVTVSPVVEVALRFGRTILLSRLVSPLEFGICVALMAFIGTIELISDISIDKFLVFHREEGDTILAVAHRMNGCEPIAKNVEIPRLRALSSSSLLLHGLNRCTKFVQHAQLVADR